MRIARRITTTATALGLGLGMALGATGCSTSLTPEMRGTVERPADVSNHVTYTNNANWRMFNDDLGRSFYTDHPSRLSPFPIMYTSGMPR